jgi:aminoglycoside 3-N-acetyltransferase I
MSFTLHHLAPHDVDLMSSMLTMFGDAFDDKDSYNSKRPSENYLKKILGGDTFIALVALKNNEVVGGIAAYELHKFEQERSEIYIYDLAVLPAHRREGIATALIEELTNIAAKRGAYVVFVQADTYPEDQPAIALYSKLGIREEVLHFDINIKQSNRKLP